MDRDELIRRAADLVPALRQRASLAEELRRLPKETVDDLHAAEILRISQPKRFGGFDLVIISKQEAPLAAIPD